jgi:hypothetical protein
MIVIDVPSTRRGGTIRVAVIGSCRVRTPLQKTANNGDFSVIISQPPLTHSFNEARQSWRHATGSQPIPDHFAPFIFDQAASPLRESYPAEILDQIDVFIVEMCDSKQVRHGDWYFQGNYFSRNFVQRHASQLLGWYRKFCKGTPVDEATIEDALKKLATAGVSDIDQIEPILRHTVLEQMDKDAVLRSARAMVHDPSKRWIFVSHFAPPDDQGPIMQDRRALATAIQAAATDVGAEFFDPTRLIEFYGRANVLRAHGADIYEYSWDFIPVMSRIIIEMARSDTVEDLALPARQSINIPAKVAEKSAKSQTDQIAADLGAKVNRLLVSLSSQRLASLGPERSGLYDRYRQLLEEGEIVRPRDTRLLQIILKQFADYDRYYVLKSGLGALPLMMALAGLKVEALDPSAYRVDAMEAAMSAMAVSKKAVTKLMTVSQGLRAAAIGGERSLVVAFGLLASEGGDNVATVDGHEAVLFDLQSPLGKELLQAEEANGTKADFEGALPIEKLTSTIGVVRRIRPSGASVTQPRHVATSA